MVSERNYDLPFLLRINSSYFPEHHQQFRIILSVHCERLQYRSTNECTYYTNIYFTLSGFYMFRLIAIFRELTTNFNIYVL